jgi:prophage regulatory protein
MMLKLPAVIRETALSRSTIYAAIKTGEFPAPLLIGKRAVAWRVEDVENWRSSVGHSLPTKGGNGHFTPGLGKPLP